MEDGKLVELAEKAGFESVAESRAAIASAFFTIASEEQIEKVARAFETIEK